LPSLLLLSLLLLVVAHQRDEEEEQEGNIRFDSRSDNDVTKEEKSSRSMVCRGSETAGAVVNDFHSSD
jgi:hypothetical protein